MTTLFQRTLVGCAAVLSLNGARKTLRVYGPRGPAAAMKEAAASFEEATGMTVRVTAGPTAAWLADAKRDADLVYTGAEAMTSDVVTGLGNELTPMPPEPLYLRAMAILVRPDNPKKIGCFTDVLKPGIKVLVVKAAGHDGAWEYVAGRTGDIEKVTRLRSNIVGYAKTGAEACQTWIADPQIDVWLTWNTWRAANPTLANAVPIEPEHAIYRDTSVAITLRGQTNSASKQFLAYLKSKEGAAIFYKWGWMEPRSALAANCL